MLKSLIMTWLLYLYVDDSLVIGGNKAQITVFKKNMMKMFEMTDLGKISYFLGMEIKQAQKEIFICQRKYLKVEVAKLARPGGLARSARN